MTETTVLAPIARNVAYLGKARTANLEAFRKFVLETDAAPAANASKVVREAFDLGNKAAGLWSKFGEDRRNGTVSPTVSFLDYVVTTTGIDVEKMSEPARAAFASGVATHSLYRKYQISKGSVEPVSVSK